MNGRPDYEEARKEAKRRFGHRITLRELNALGATYRQVWLRRDEALEPIGVGQTWEEAFDAAERWLARHEAAQSAGGGAPASPGSSVGPDKG